MIIQYWLESKDYGCTCCGEFSSWSHFDKFVKLQNWYNKTVTQVVLLKL